MLAAINFCASYCQNACAMLNSYWLNHHVGSDPDSQEQPLSALIPAAKAMAKEPSPKAKTKASLKANTKANAKPARKAKPKAKAMVTAAADNAEGITEVEGAEVLMTHAGAEVEVGTEDAVGTEATPVGPKVEQTIFCNWCQQPVEMSQGRYTTKSLHSYSSCMLTH